MLDKGVLYPIHKIMFNQNYFNGIRRNSFSIITMVDELYICVYLPRSTSICQNLFQDINNNAINGEKYKMCYYGKTGNTNVVRIHHPQQGRVNFYYSKCVS